MKGSMGLKKKKKAPPTTPERAGNREGGGVGLMRGGWEVITG